MQRDFQIRQLRNKTKYNIIQRRKDIKKQGVEEIKSMFLEQLNIPMLTIQEYFENEDVKAFDNKEENVPATQKIKRAYKRRSQQNIVETIAHNNPIKIPIKRAIKPRANKDMDSMITNDEKEKPGKLKPFKRRYSRKAAESQEA